MNGLLELLILHIVRIVTLVDVGTEFLHELFLHAAMLLYLLMGKLDGFEHIVLAHLVHLALHHHDVLLSGGHHKFEVGILHLREGRVDHELAVDTADADLRYRTSERKVGRSQGA